MMINKETLWKAVIAISGAITILGYLVSFSLGYFVESGLLPNGVMIIPRVLFVDGLYWVMFVLFIGSYSAWRVSGRKSF